MEEFEIELKLYELMSDLQKVSIDLENAIEPYMTIVEENLKKQEEVSVPYSKRCEEIQNQIKKLTLLRAKSLKTGSGNITYVKGANRRNWNLDALDTICETDEYIKEKIWDFREENLGEPQVRIKVETKGKSVTEI